MKIRASRYVRLFIACSITCFALFANAAGKPKTYALVVGITTYEDAIFNNLVYPASDAVRFAEYLKHNRKEDFKPEQLKLLLNEEATLSAVLRGMRWLQDVCKAKDTAFIFFSGHGALETLAFANEGYLLTFNTPRYHYNGLAISIKDLNALANTLSIKNKAKVVLVTDACHSGNVAGNFLEYKPLVGEALSQVLQNEVRLAACQPNELAKEGSTWGGGVLTYNLLNGLYGEADINNDGKVLYNELSEYLSVQVPNDPQLRLLNDLQHPALDGPPKFVVGEAVPKNEQLATTKSEAPGDLLSLFDKAEMSPMDYFFFKIRQYPFESRLASNNIRNLAAENWGSSIVENLLQSHPVVEEDNPLFHRDSLAMLWKQLRNSNSLGRLFSEKLMDWVHDRGVSMIDAYLDGDLDELERREYYTAGSRTYENLIIVQQIMLEAMDSRHPLRSTMQLHHQYLSGLICRLNMAIYSQTDSLLNAAILHQYMAQQLDDKTGYVNNELGNLHLLARRIDSAKLYFTMATRLAPAWAIPWSNLISCYTLSQNADSARIAAHIADSLQPKLSIVYTNMAMAFEAEGNLLMAAENYYRAIDYNKVHFLPYERLANLWLGQQDIEAADYYFFETSQRKEKFLVNEESFAVKERVAKFVFSTGRTMAMPPKPRCFEGTKESELMVFSYLDSAEMAMYKNQNDVAIRFLEKVVQLNPTLPFVSHRLGILYREKDLNDKAIAAFKKSIANYIPINQLPDYIKKTYPRISKDFFYCYESEILERFGEYSPLEDYYLLADTYEKNNSPDAAIAIYKRLMEDEKSRDLDRAAAWVLRNDKEGTIVSAHYKIFSEEADQLLYRPFPQIAFLKLMKVYESKGEFKEAEEVLLDQINIQQQCGWVRDSVLHGILGDLANELGITFDSMIIVAATSSNYEDIAYNYYWLRATYLSQLVALDFYKRMIFKFPRDPHWSEQGGLWLWQRLKLAYTRLHPSQYAAFAESISDFEFPWYTAEISNERGASIAIPGIDENIRFEPLAMNPLTTAMEWLYSSWQLYKNNNPKPAVVSAISDLLIWQNKIDSALAWIALADSRNTISSSERLGIINAMLFHRQVKVSWQQLEKVNDWSVLTKDNLESWNKLSLLNKDFKKAEQLGFYMRANHPMLSFQNSIDEIKWQWLKGEKQRAFLMLKDSLAASSEKLHASDASDGSVDKINSDSVLSVAYYILARMSMDMGDEEFAKEALLKALDHRYVGYYLLSYDPLFTHWRDRPDWIALIDKTRKTDYTKINFNEFSEHKTAPHINGAIDFRSIKIPSRFR